MFKLEKRVNLLDKEDKEMSLETILVKKIPLPKREELLNLREIMLELRAFRVKRSTFNSKKKQMFLIRN